MYRNVVLLIIVFLLTAPAPQAFAQEVTPRYLFSQIKAKCKLNTISVTDSLNCKFHLFETVFAGEKIFITLKENDAGIEHTGLFIPAISGKSNLSSVLTAFVERTFLFVIIANDLQLKSEFDDNRIRILGNNSIDLASGKVFISEILPILMRANTVLLNSYISEKSNNSSGYEITISDSMNQKVSILFPARMDIILGLEKTQLDSLVFTQLCSASTTVKPVNFCAPVAEELTTVSGTRILQTVKKEYEGYTSQRYYQKNDTGYQAVLSSKYPLESMSNIAQGLPIANSPLCRVQVQNYHKQLLTCLAPITQIISTLAKDAEVYIAIEQPTVDTNLTTILFLNRQFNYLHMMYFNWSPTTFFSSTPATVQSTVYGYIRLDNVQNLQGIYYERKNKLKVKRK